MIRRAIRFIASIFFPRKLRQILPAKRRMSGGVPETIVTWSPYGGDLQPVAIGGHIERNAKLRDRLRAAAEPSAMRDVTSALANLGFGPRAAALVQAAARKVDSADFDALFLAAMQEAR